MANYELGLSRTNSELGPRSGLSQCELCCNSWGVASVSEQGTEPPRINLIEQ